MTLDAGTHKDRELGIRRGDGLVEVADRVHALGWLRAEDIEHSEGRVERGGPPQHTVSGVPHGRPGYLAARPGRRADRSGRPERDRLRLAGTNLPRPPLRTPNGLRCRIDQTRGRTGPGIPNNGFVTSELTNLRAVEPLTIRS